MVSFPDESVEIARPLIPPSRLPPQGGAQDMLDEALLAAITQVQVGGGAAPAPRFGMSKSPARRQFGL